MTEVGHTFSIELDDLQLEQLRLKRLPGEWEEKCLRRLVAAALVPVDTDFKGTQPLGREELTARMLKALTE